jgi:hypothetical protein
MKPELLFQRLVICSTALFIGYLSTFLLLEPRLPDEVKGALSWNGYGAKLPMSESIWWFVALLRVLVTVGLYLFSREARAVFVGLAIYSAVTSLLGGVNVSTGTGVFLGYLLALCEGAVLVLAFTSPIRDRFIAAQSETPTTTGAGAQHDANQPPAPDL